MKVSKEKIFEHIQKIDFKHERAADFRAKISRSDDCFAMMHSEKNKLCKTCKMLITYDGEEMEIRELCKRLMEIRLVEENKQKARPADTPAEKDEAEKPRQKIEGRKQPTIRRLSDDAYKAIILKRLKEGAYDNLTVAEGTHLAVSRTYAIMRKMVEDGILEKYKDGKKNKYRTTEEK